MWSLVSLSVALFAAFAQATPYQRRYNTTVATNSTQRVPPPPQVTVKPTSICTGCVIKAYATHTVAFDEAQSSSWTSVVKTETVLSKTVSYFTGTPAKLQTVVTEIETLNQTAMFTGASHELITHTAPVLIVEPTPGVTLELPMGTYLFYDNVYGGLNQVVSATTDASYLETTWYSVPHPTPTAPSNGSAPSNIWAPSLLKRGVVEPTCKAAVESLKYKIPSRTEDWRHFYQSVTSTIPMAGGTTPQALPSALLGYLNQDSGVISALGGSNVSSCTQLTTTMPETTSKQGESTSANLPSASPGFSSVAESLEPPSYPSSAPAQPQSTYIRTTYQPTSTHVTVRGCLRCDIPYQTPVVQTQNQNFAGGAPAGHNNNQQPGAGQVVYVGGSTFSVRPAKPTNQGQGTNSNQGVAVGTLTLYPGQTTTLNNIQVAVPTTGGGSILVVGTNTYQVLPTGAPALSVGDAILTANSQNQFIVGTQTLSPGGPAITVNGYTMSLASDGTRAIINGKTQTLVNNPYTTGAPVMIIGGQTVTASILDGTTEFILEPGKTLLPGNALTISGTTYSMPVDGSGSVIVINGVTSTLGLGFLTAAPDITIAGSTYTATVRDGTTEYVLSPGTTLRPGDVITISGTTYSLDSLDTALVINGQTSTISKVPASNSATPTSSAPATTSLDDGKNVETAVSTSSKGNAVSIRRWGLDLWVESLIVGLASWTILLL